MKLTYRDKIILAIILAIAVLLLGFFALVKPKYKDIQDNQTKLETLEKDRAAKQALINQIPGLKEDITKIYNDTNKITKMFVPVKAVQDPENVDKYMIEVAEKNKLKVTSINVASASISEIPYYFNTPTDNYGEARVGADLNGKIQDEINKDKEESAALTVRPKSRILETRYGITLTGTKVNIEKYLNDLKNSGKAINVSSISLGDFTFGKQAAKEANTEMPDSPDGEEVKIDVGGKEISNATQAQIVISIYSVYEMDQPNLD